MRLIKIKDAEWLNTRGESYNPMIKRYQLN